jgi:hypothetical protein
VSATTRSAIAESNAPIDGPTIRPIPMGRACAIATAIVPNSAPA